MRRMSGFSLMEMMVVLLITAIVAAASAPMINKKLMHDQAENGSPWLYAGQDNSIVYNVKGAPQTVSIGGMKPNDGTNPSLFIKQNTSGKPHIMLKNNNDDPMEIRYESSSIYLTDKLNQNASNSVVIGGGKASAGERAVTLGANASAKNGGIAIGGPTEGDDLKPVEAGQNAIAIGSGANSTGIAIGSGAQSTGIAIGSGANSKGIAIGDSAKANVGRAVAIGDKAQANEVGQTWGAIAIGYEAKATKADSIAIGDAANANYASSIAIGANVGTSRDNQIRIGTTAHTVYIPGNLVVGQTTILGATGKFGTYVTMTGDGEDKPKQISKTASGGPYNSEFFNGITIDSDRRLKNVGKAFVGGLEDVKKLEVFNYTYKKDTTKTPHVGVMAQDLEKIFPKAVFKGDDGFLRIRMEDMFYAVVNAIKELDSKFEALRNNEIKTLQKQVADLEKQNKELLKRIEKIEKNLK